MRMTRAAIAVARMGLLGTLALTARAQLPEPNEAGVGAGHIHLTVPSVAEHEALWQTLGGEAKSTEAASIIVFPGMYVLLSEGSPSPPSSETAVNHVGFTVRDYASYRGKLDEIDAAIVFESAENGQVIADLPDGVRLELLAEPDQTAPIAFHHVHLATSAEETALRDWYLDVFGAEAGERRGLPSALVPGARIDVMPARDGRPAASQGAAIDHIGFEVADMDAFAARARRLGIEFDRPPARYEEVGLTVAFLTDPAGAYIEVTEGLETAFE